MTPAKLIALESRFGGLCVGVPRRKVSPLDPRPPSVTSVGGMQGGDRMDHHGYAGTYAKFLPRRASTVVEMGILRGQGLALLSAIYPDARLIGLDVDLSHYAEHREVLKGYGAFYRDPDVMEFDQLSDQSWKALERVIEPGSVDVWIDDALHDDKSVIGAALRAIPFMAKDGVYFIEDNNGAASWLARSMPDMRVHRKGSLTVIKAKN